MRHTTQMKPKKYLSIEKCIYCLKPFSPENLTDEHIIPLALNGSLIIKKAACELCRDYTNKNFENVALQADFYVPRLLLELKRRKKAIQKKLPNATLKLDDGSIIQSITLELEDYPTIVNFFYFEPAGFLVGKNKSGALDSMRLQFLNLPLPRKYNFKSIETSHKMNFTAFSKTLAKIAYCFAIAEKGVNYFDGDGIRDLILGERSDVFNFVGGIFEPESAPDNQLHVLILKQRGEYLTTIIHLFSSFKALTYEVVVGAINTNP